MSSRNVSSSDLHVAKQLSRRLAFGPPVPEAGSPKVNGSYVTFRSSTAPEVERVAPMPARRVEAEATELPRPPASVRNWDDMLRWCQEAAAAKAVFVMDSQGFVIAKEGGASYEDAEAMGTQIMVALDRFDELDTFNKRALSVTVEFRSFWLTGIRVPAETRDCFTLGVLRTDPPTASLVQEVTREVCARAGEL